MKRLLLLALTTVTLLQAAEKRGVFVNMPELANQSKDGAALRSKAEALQNDVQAFFQKEQANFAKMKEALSNLPEEEREAKLAAESRRAQFACEEKQREAQAKIKVEQQKLEKGILDEVQRLAKAEGWSSVSDSSICLYVDKDLLQTNKVLEALNKTHDAEVAKAAVSKSHDAEVTKAAVSKRS